ncbi:ATP-binding protein [Rhodococcus sp. BE178]|uniref:ATP-binding protein n=1 Tax=Rhodococcus sp. BE178 TaxID=2817737 RepID=UPI003D1EF591
MDYPVDMSWTAERLQDVLADLRTRGGDRTEIEVKRASGGCPGLAETLCAFGNMPEGGTILLGIDEARDFEVVGVTSVADIEKGVASQARNAVAPPVNVTFEHAIVDGRDVVIAGVAGLPDSDRPCRLVRGGAAYLRQGDGDYRMSDQEVAQLIALRNRPRYDADAVQGSSTTDLDKRLVTLFLSEARSSSRRLADATDGQILRWKGVTASDGTTLTIAGLYALGQFPQQFAPSLAITAAVELPDRTEGRTRDLVHLDGPIPEMLDHAMEWVRRNTRSVIRYGADGHGVNQSEIPMIAVRELIANALVHRDLGPHTQSKRVEIRLRDDKLIIANPGGLWGISRDQLGMPTGKSAVNEFLYEICKLTRTTMGNRVVEGEGGGIREVRSALRQAGMRPPEFHDTGVRFTAIVPRHALLSPDDLSWLAAVVKDAPLSDVQRQILASMRHGQEWTNSFVREEFAPIYSVAARAVLQGLVAAGFAAASGDRGGTTYHLAPNLVEGNERTVPTVEILDNPVAASEVSAPGAPANLIAISSNASTIWDALDQPRSVRELTEVTGLGAHQVRYALAKMVDNGIVHVDGGPGRRGTRYRRSS